MFKRRPGMTREEFREYWYARRISYSHPQKHRQAEMARSLLPQGNEPRTHLHVRERRQGEDRAV